MRENRERIESGLLRGNLGGNPYATYKQNKKSPPMRVTISERNDTSNHFRT